MFIRLAVARVGTANLVAGAGTQLKCKLINHFGLVLLHRRPAPGLLCWNRATNGANDAKTSLCLLS